MSSEYVDAITLANRVLDKPYIDPDGDICLLARQFLALTSRAEAAEAQVAALRMTLNMKRDQLKEYTAGIDPTAGESRRHALTIAEGRLLQIDMDIAALSSLPASPATEKLQARVKELEGALDTGSMPERVVFYEREFYVLSNFSSFRLLWKDIDFDTSEAAYHWEKFQGEETRHARSLIRRARSAHEAFKAAEHFKHLRRADWSDVRLGIMRDILRTKAAQHEYLRRKLLETGDRELVENSWRDDFWGWGPNRDGQNMLGKLWMEVRGDLRRAASALKGEG